MISWVALVITLAVVFAFYLIWQEYYRNNIKNRILRIIASLIAVSSLLFVAIEPTYHKVVSRSTAVLLTEGFDEDSVKAFRSKANNQPILYSNSGNIVGRLSTDVKVINYVPSLSDTLSAFKEVHVFGHGYNETDAEFFKGLNVIHHASPLPQGMKTTNWTGTIRFGEELQIKGEVYSNRSNSKMILMMAGEMLDSATVNISNRFELGAYPKQIGRAVYTLAMLDGTDTIELNNIPFEVLPINKVSILSLSSTPDFENRFLKNWLAENQYSFAQRTTISRDKYDQQYLNLPAKSLHKISSSLLENFNILICDDVAYNGLSASEQQAIRMQVENKGMGLIIRAGGSLRDQAFFSDLIVRAPADLSKKILNLTLGSSSKLPPLTVDAAASINRNEQIRPLIKNSDNNIMAAVGLRGRGRVLVTTINNTYSWVMEGNSSDYYLYWSSLIGNVANDNSTPNPWTISPAKPRPGEPLNIYFRSKNDSVPIIIADSILLAPIQDPLISFVWNARWWPYREGWHLISNNGSAASWFYIYPSNQWKTYTAAKRLSNMRSARAKSSTNMSPVTVQAKIPAILFFLLFLFAVSYLWFEKKLVMSS